MSQRKATHPIRASVTQRAADLKRYIQRQVPSGPVHVIGHSMGGLDARYMTARLGMEGRVSWTPADLDRFATQVDRWRVLGATHLTIDTMSTGQTTIDDHIAALEQAANLIGFRATTSGQADGSR